MKKLTRLRLQFCKGRKRFRSIIIVVSECTLEEYLKHDSINYPMESKIIANFIIIGGNHLELESMPSTNAAVREK